LQKKKRSEAVAEYQKQQKIAKSQSSEVKDKFGRKLVNSSGAAEGELDEAENDRVEAELAEWLQSVAGVEVSQLASIQQQAVAEAQKAATEALMEEKKKSLFDKFGI
jgi:hypothetical protein